VAGLWALAVADPRSVEKHASDPNVSVYGSPYASLAGSEALTCANDAQSAGTVCAAALTHLGRPPRVTAAVPRQGSHRPAGALLVGAPPSTTA